MSIAANRARLAAAATRARLQDLVYDPDSEAISYIPHNGPARTIRANVDRNRSVEYQDGGTETDQLSIGVLVGRDETLVDPEGNLVGGVALPRPGDQVRLIEDADPDDRPYVYYDTEMAAPEKWRLVFARTRKTARGIES